MVARKLMPIIIGLLVILQIAFMFIPNSAILAILGCIVILISAIHWELKGGLYSATLCSLILLTGNLFVIKDNSVWLLIIVTIILYYFIGIGIGGIVGLLRKQKLSLTEREARYKLLNSEITIKEELLRITLHSIGDGVICTDNHGNVTMFNDMSRKLTGWSEDIAIGSPFTDVFMCIDDITREKCENILEKILESGEILELANHTVLISKDGTERPIEESAAPIRNTKGEIIGAILVFRDVSEKRQRQKEIEFLSYHDKLTGLYNRRFYEEELMRLDTKRNYPLTIVMGDVNGLKLINDSFGHAMGDELLMKAAVVIKNGCRVDDIIARLGGDEFVALLPKTNGEDAELIISRINDLSRIEMVGNSDIYISFGYATKNNEEENIQDTFKNAEDLMYRNKRSESAEGRWEQNHRFCLEHAIQKKQ